MKGHFLHEVEKVISVISIQDLSKKIDFPSLKKKTSISREKSKCFLQFFFIKIGKTEFSFLKMHQTIQVNIREYVSINFTIK